MDDFVEMTLSRQIATTNTSFIRAAIRDRINADGLDGPPVELVRFHVFLHCTRGTGRHMVDFEDFELQAGTVLWIRPGQVQRWSDIDDDFDADVVVFESSAIPDLPLFDHFAGRTSTAQIGSDSKRLTNQMTWLAADLEATNDTGMAAAVVGVILRLFARHVDAAAERNDHRHRLATAFVDSIDQNIKERAVTWHSQHIGASARSIARATVEVLGLRPKEVIDSRVILEAQRRLAWSTDDIATVARTLRFSEPSNFTKFFRARTGMSPSAFRESVTEPSSQID
jgi:AraC-like DNA-binding protein